MSNKSTEPEEVEPDRLIRAEQAKRRVITVDGKELILQKWNLRVGMRLTGKMLKLLRTVLKGITGDVVANPETDNATKLTAMMAQDFDISGLLEDNYDDIVEILAVSARKNNFDNETDAREWVEALSLEDVIDLAAPIVEMNVRPLMGTVGKLGNLLGGVNGNQKSEQAPKEPEQQT